MDRFCDSNRYASATTHRRRESQSSRDSLLTYYGPLRYLDVLLVIVELSVTAIGERVIKYVGVITGTSAGVGAVFVGLAIPTICSDL